MVISGEVRIQCLYIKYILMSISNFDIIFTMQVWKYSRALENYTQPLTVPIYNQPRRVCNFIVFENIFIIAQIPDSLCVDASLLRLVAEENWLYSKRVRHRGPS